LSGRSGPINYSGQLTQSLTQVIVDHGGGGQAAAARYLLLAFFDPAADVLFVVPASGQPGGLGLDRRRQEEDDRGVGPFGQDLLGALHIDLEQDVGPVGRARNRGAHEIAEELGPLEELTPADRVFEVGAVDELIGLSLAFTRPRWAGRPTPAQPQGRVRGNEFGRQRALPGPAGADEHEDQWFSAQSL
jgi:hypothetical protein